MLVFVPFMLLFLMLGLLVVIAVGLMVAHYILSLPRFLEKFLDHDEKHCACFLGFKQHNVA